MDELHRIDELLPQLGIALGCGPRRAAGEQSALQLHSFPEINPIVVRAELDSVLELFRLQAQKRKAESAAELTTRCGRAWDRDDPARGCLKLGRRVSSHYKFEPEQKGLTCLAGKLQSVDLASRLQASCALRNGGCEQ